jgi:hypothetical protein
MRRIRSDSMTEPEKEVLIEYILQMCMRDKSSEVAVFNLLAPMAYSMDPLCNKLHKLSIPIAFMYVEYDWVSREVGDKLIE